MLFLDYANLEKNITIKQILYQNTIDVSGSQTQGLNLRFFMGAVLPFIKKVGYYQRLPAPRNSTQAASFRP